MARMIQQGPIRDPRAYGRKTSDAKKVAEKIYVMMKIISKSGVPQHSICVARSRETENGSRQADVDHTSDLTNATVCL